MPEDETQHSGAEEYVAAVIELSHPLDPEQKQALRNSLGGLNPGLFAS